MENHLPALIQDLAIILISAAVVSIIFKKIKQPLVLGYIIAGFLVGPYFTLFPTVVDEGSIDTWAEIGVIFLLFSLGLEFSFKKLIKVGGSASITALVEIIFICTLGFFVAQWMGWNTMDSIFLAGMLASSSTTIILKAFDELGVKHQKFAGIVFGVLVVEDIVVIILMVLLSTMAVSQQFDGNELLFAIGKLLFFLIAIYLIGIYILPTVLRKAKKLLDEETLLIISVGLCFLLVVLAVRAGLSAELGAFVMGTILAETTFAERIEHITKPTKDLFGAVFFVSIGMMINPAELYNYKWQILIITIVVIVGKLISTTLGAVLSGQPLRQSVQVGMSMAQIGEFAFIVAALGLSLNVTSDFLFPVAVGVSAITTFTTPLMIRTSDHVFYFIEKITPAGLLRGIEKYSFQFQNIQQEGAWKKLMKAYFSTILINLVVIIAIVLVAYNVILPFLDNQFTDTRTSRGITVALVLLVCIPFLWPIAFKRINRKEYKDLWRHSYISRGPLILIDLLRIVLGIIILQFILYRFYPSFIISVFLVPVALLVIYFLSTKIDYLHNLIVKRFMFNFYERDFRDKEKRIAEEKKVIRPSTKINSFWDTYVTDFEVGQYGEYIGKQLQDLGWRENYDINVAYIKRGSNIIYAPTGSIRIFPFDHIGLIGTEDQIKEFEDKKFKLEEKAEEIFTQPDLEDFTLMNFQVNRTAPFIGKTIREIELREKTDGLVVGIERGEEKLLNPSSDTILLLDDLVYLVGNKKMIKEFIKENNL